MMCNGSASSITKAKTRGRQYALLIHKVGYPVCLSRIQIVTMSAVRTLRHPLNLRQLPIMMNGQYEPEVYPPLMFKINGINFTCFITGKVIITGIKSMAVTKDKAVPVILELAILAELIFLNKSHFRT